MPVDQLFKLDRQAREIDAQRKAEADKQRASTVSEQNVVEQIIESHTQEASR